MKIIGLFFMTLVFGIISMITSKKYKLQGDLKELCFPPVFSKILYGCFIISMICSVVIIYLWQGRRPVTKGFGLENLNLDKTGRGAIKVNEKMQTSLSGVYVCGDLTGFSLLAHTAVREAEVAVHSILGKEDAMSYRAIPGVVYTNPEIAGVGETEESASAKGITYKVVKLPMAYSGRFVAENEGVNGVCKVLLDEQERIIGAHVLGNPASEIITLAGAGNNLPLPKVAGFPGILIR